MTLESDLLTHGTISETEWLFKNILKLTPFQSILASAETMSHLYIHKLVFS